jgi:hypothetical protein
MTLILTVPALQGYSMVMYQDWRSVVAEYVAARSSCRPTDFQPRVAGWLLLGVAIAAYEQWLADDASSLADLLTSGADVIRDGLVDLPRLSSS